MQARVFVRLVVVSLACSLLVAWLLAAGQAMAATAPAISSLTSVTHPNPATWYQGRLPGFSWAVTPSSGTTVAGYSLVVDHAASTVPTATANLGAIAFTRATYWSAGDNPWALTVADIDGDGKKDLPLVNYGSNTMVVMRGLGSGTFLPGGTQYSAGNWPESIATADLNADGKLDIVAANAGGNSVSVFKNNGPYTLMTETFVTVGANPVGIVSGDFDGDGKQDVATCNNGAYTISVLLGKGDLTFNAKADYATGNHPVAIVTADFDGDGKLDLATADDDTGGMYGLSVLRGNGDGTFQSKIDYASSSYTYGKPGAKALAVGDFNGDGRLDIALAFSGNGYNGWSVLLRNLDFSFQAPVSYVSALAQAGVAVADFNNDGKQDVALVYHAYYSSDARMQLFLNTGSGSFQSGGLYWVGYSPNAIVAADFDGNGRSDVAVAAGGDDEIDVLLNSSATPVADYTQPTNLADGTWYFHLRAVDNLGDWSGTSTFAFHVDGTAPTTAVDAPAVPVARATVTFTPSDPVGADGTCSGVPTDGSSTWYRVDGGAWQSGTSVTLRHMIRHKRAGYAYGEHVIQFYSVDNAGNVEAVKSCTVTIG